MPKFKDVKKQLIQCLADGSVLHEARSDIDIKNLLTVGAVSTEKVTQILKQSRGTEYETSPHHMGQGVDVHVVKTHYESEEWYIKWYFVEPDVVFISVHK
jgi:hypothetical protein